MPSDPTKQVAVLIIVYQNRLTDLEKISLQQCLKVLKNYPIRLVKPASLDLSDWPSDAAAVPSESFPDKYFKDIGAYSRLLISREFYKRFIQFEYILIYQLDAFVFKDNLHEWCSKGYDYIGAPWFENFSNDQPDASLVGVGNGGFSLRRVKAHLKVLHSFSYLNPPKENWKSRMKAKPRGIKWLSEAAGFFLDLWWRNNTFWLLNSFRGFEDQFWSLIVPRNFKWFRLAGIQEAIDFSIEMQPRRVYAMNSYQLPFGCHAWWKYDFAFWRPHIKACGYEL
ncbi:MAG: hypothetical protein INR73_10360 [Williamsia sp.]|nr:hypothetical protein [Williamsia sp.]